MSDETKQDPKPEEEKPSYTPASRGKRIAAGIAAAVLFSFLAALLFKPGDKR